MRALPISAVTGAILAVILGALLFVAGCWYCQSTGEPGTDAREHIARADSLEAAALRDRASADSLRALADAEAAARRTLQADSARLAARIRTLSTQTAAAEGALRDLTARFSQTGDVDDCRAALDGCLTLTDAQADELAETRALLDVAGQINASQGREIVHLRTANDTLHVAAARTLDALAEQRLATDAETARANRMTAQRDIWRILTPVGTALGFVLGVLAAR